MIYFQGDMDFDIYTHAVYYNVCWKFTKIYVMIAFCASLLYFRVLQIQGDSLTQFLQICLIGTW